MNREATPMAEAMDAHRGARNIEIQYDNSAKDILSYKVFLARILKGSMAEFSDTPLTDVEKAIGDDMLISKVNLLPQQEKILGQQNDDSEAGEGKITYDIRTYVRLPNDEYTKVIINIEAQKKHDPGYDLVTRAMFYCSRLISSQMNTEFSVKTVDKLKYDGIKKVYSIWIVMNAEPDMKNTIVRYQVQPEVLYRSHRHQAPLKNFGRYDILTAIMIHLDVEFGEESNDLLGVLNTLFGSMKTAQKKKVLEQKYNIPMTVEIEKKVNEMCNLGEGIAEINYDKGIREGKAEGKAEGMLKIAISMWKKGKLTEKEAAEEAGVTLAEFKKAVLIMV